MPNALHIVPAGVVMILAMLVPAAGQDFLQWRAQMGSVYDPGPWSGIGIGGQYADNGYYGQPGLDVSSFSGVGLLLYRRSGVDGWTGATGFYGFEFKPPMPAGGQTTWPDIYLWAQNYTPWYGDKAGVRFAGISPYEFPRWYNALLVLDYVPPSLNWTGPTTFDMRAVGGGMWLPVPIVTEPLQGVRMHLTVYAGPIPEPSSLTALAIALAGLGGALVRRRRLVS